MTPIDLICENIINTEYDHLSSEFCHHAKLRIIDVIGCAIGGVNDKGNQELSGLVQQWGGSPEATILVQGHQAPAHHVAMVNSTFARSFDYEALGPLVEGKSIPAHISGTTVMTALAMSEFKHATGKKLLASLLAGDDIVSRILAATGHGGLPPGWDHVGTANAFGSTAIAGKLIGLSPVELRHAFGIALNQMSGSMQNIWDGSPVFKLLQGLSSQNGIFSARLAQAGWTGPEDPLLSDYGYFQLFTAGCKHPEILTRELGQQYYADAHFKPYPCCAVSHSAIDCALKIGKENVIEVDEIERVILYVPRGGFKSFLAQPIKITDHPHASVLFNYRYHVASALIRKCVLPEHFSENAIGDQSVLALADKITLELLPDQNTDLLSSGLEVIMKNRQKYRVETAFPTGEPLHHPLSQDDIINKFFNNISFSNHISRIKAEKALEQLLDLESLKNIGELIRLLVKD